MCAIWTWEPALQQRFAVFLLPVVTRQLHLLSVSYYGLWHFIVAYFVECVICMIAPLQQELSFGCVPFQILVFVWLQTYLVSSACQILVFVSELTYFVI